MGDLIPPWKKRHIVSPGMFSLPPKWQRRSYWYFRKMISTATWFLTLPEGYLTCLWFLCSMEGQSSIPSNSLERKQSKWISYSTKKTKLQWIYSRISLFFCYPDDSQCFGNHSLAWTWDIYFGNQGFSFGKYPPFQHTSTDDMLVNYEMFTRWGKGTDMALEKSKSLGLPFYNATSDQIIIFTLMWHVQGTVVASFSVSTMMKKYWSVSKDGSKVVINPDSSLHNGHFFMF